MDRRSKVFQLEYLRSQINNKSDKNKQTKKQTKKGVTSKPKLKGGGMDPLLVLVSPCFRENVVVTCKIGSFLCSLDNLLHKNVIVFFFENRITKWRSSEKKGYF